MLQYKRRRKVLITIEPFHMTSRPPHTLVTQNNETAAILVIWELNLPLMLKLLLVAINSLSCWPREWKRFIDHWPHYTLMWDLRRETNATIWPGYQGHVPILATPSEPTFRTFPYKTRRTLWAGPTFSHSFSTFARPAWSTQLGQDNQDPVVRRPISANPGLNFNPGFFFFCWKVFSRIIFASFFKSILSPQCR